MFFLLMLTSCVRTENNDEINEANTKEFMKFFINATFKEDSIILVAEEFKIEARPSCILENIEKEKSAKFYLENLLADSSIVWTRKQVPNVKILSKHSLPINKQLNWPTFHKKIGEGFFRLSRPIFSVNYDYVFIYSAYYCDDRCGNESLMLYKRVLNGWQLVKTYCELIS